MYTYYTVQQFAILRQRPPRLPIWNIVTENSYRTGRMTENISIRANSRSVYEIIVPSNFSVY